MIVVTVICVVIAAVLLTAICVRASLKDVGFYVNSYKNNKGDIVLGKNKYLSVQDAQASQRCPEGYKFNGVLALRKW